MWCCCFFLVTFPLWVTIFQTFSIKPKFKATFSLFLIHYRCRKSRSLERGVCHPTIANHPYCQGRALTFELWLIINIYQFVSVILDTTAGEYCSSFGYNGRFSWYFMSISLSLKFLLSPFPNLFFFNSVRFSLRSRVGELIRTWEKRRELCWESFTPDDCYKVQKIDNKII